MDGVNDKVRCPSRNSEQIDLAEFFERYAARNNNDEVRFVKSEAELLAKALRAYTPSGSVLTRGELDALIDYHDWNDAGAEAMGLETTYHEERSKHFKTLRDALVEVTR